MDTACLAYFASAPACTEMAYSRSQPNLVAVIVEHQKIPTLHLTFLDVDTCAPLFCS
jgi:hypothetical protein